MTDTFLSETRARWRITVHRRDFTSFGSPRATGLAEITDARSRRLEMGWNGSPAKLTLTVDGRSPSADYIDELITDLVAWRFDPADNTEYPMFRGVVSASEDTISEQAHTVNFTAMDYSAVLARRYLNPKTDLVYTQLDQDSIVGDLLNRATSGQAPAAGTPSFAPGSALPISRALVGPDGATRSGSGKLRDRTYTGGSSIGGLIGDLGDVDGGFDWDIQPYGGDAAGGRDLLRVWYPSRGVGRTDVALIYGATVSALTRNVQSATTDGDSGYANYVRVLGDNGGTAGAPQLVADAWNADANDIGRIPVGLWAAIEQASDVKVQATLNEKAAGDLARWGTLVPAYTLTLRPGWYRPGFPNLGDTVPLVVDSGRLHVSGTVRVLGLAFDIGDDAEETVEMTVGRPASDFTALFRKTRRDVDALARR